MARIKELFKEIGGHRITVYGASADLLEWVNTSTLAQDLFKDIKSYEDSLYLALGHLDEKRSVLAASGLMKELWSHFPELGPYALGDTLIEFQFDRRFYGNYRDHAVHQLKVFLLGLFVYDNCSKVKQAIDEEIGAQYDGAIQLTFMKRWLAAALFHDIGYVLENDEISGAAGTWQKTKAELESVIRTPLAAMAQFRGKITPAEEQEICNKHAIAPAVALSPEHIAQFRSESLFVHLNPEGILAGLAANPNGEPPVKLYFEFAKAHAPPAPRKAFFDHGIVSALLLLHVWKAFKERVENFIKLDHEPLLYAVRTELKSLHNRLDSEFVNIRAAAAAIAMHNINKDVWAEHEYASIAGGLRLAQFCIRLTGDGVSRPSGPTPLAFLLGFCDSLQDWDRPVYRAPRHNDKRLYDQDISITAKNGRLQLYLVQDHESFVSPASYSESQFNKALRAMKAYLEPRAIDDLLQCADGNYAPHIQGEPQISSAPPVPRYHTQEGVAEKRLEAIPPLKGELIKISPVHYIDQYTLLDERGLFGRAVELDNLTQWLQGRQFNNTRILSLTELGGAGKTALAWYWLTNRVDDGGLLGEAGFDGALWLSFYSDPSWGFENLWREIIVRFGETDRKIVDSMDSAEVSRTVVEVLKKRRLLLVLDGVERAMVEYLRHRKLGLEEPSTFGGARNAALSKGALVDRRAGEVLRRIAALPAGKSGSCILLTSRLGLRDLETSSKSDRECEGTRRIVLEPMQMPESLQFWTWCSGEPPANEVLLPLLSAVGCHAIVIRVLALAVKALGGWKHWVAKHPDYLPWNTTNLLDETANYWESLLSQDLSLVPQYQHLLTHWGFSSPLVRIFVSELRHAGGAEAWGRSHPNLANGLGEQDGALRLARALVLSSALEDLRENVAAWTVLQILCSPSPPTRRQDLEQTFLTEIDNEEGRENAAAALDLLIQRGVIGSARQRNQDGRIGEYIYDVHPVIRTHVWDGQFASRVRYLDALSRAQSAMPGESPRLENLDQVNGAIVRYEHLIYTLKDYPKAWDFLDQKLSPKLREAKALPGVAAKLVNLYEKLCSVTGGIGIPLLPQRQHQAEVLNTLSKLYHEAGRALEGDRANRLAATLFLLAGDTERYLMTLQNRNWSPMYSGNLVEARASLVSLWKLRPAGYRGLAVAAWLALVDAIRGQGQTLDRLVVGLKPQLGSQNRWILQTLAESFVYLGRSHEAIELLDVIAQFDVDNVFAPAERGQLMWERLTRGMALVDAYERLSDEQANAALAVLDEAYALASNLDSYLFGQALTLAYRAKAFSKALHLDDAEREMEHFNDMENAHFYQIPLVEARIAQARIFIGQGKNGDAVQVLQEAFNRAVTTRTTQDGVSFGYAKGEREIHYLLSQIQEPKFLRKRVEIIHSETQISDSLLASFEKPETWEDKREEYPADNVRPEDDDFETFELGQSSDPEVTSENQYSGLPPWWQVYAESRWPDWLPVVTAFLQREQVSRDDFPRIFDSTATPDISVIVRRAKRHQSPGGNPILNLTNHIKSELVRWVETRKPEGTPYQEIKSEADFDPFLRFARARLKYDTSQAAARLWWDEMETHCRNDPSALLAIADELIAVEATIDEFYRQLCAAPAEDTLSAAISAMLAVRLDESILTRTISKTVGWTDDRLLRRSERLKDRLLLHKCEKRSRRWYSAFDVENKHRLSLVVRFYEELWSMQANLQQFFDAISTSETDNIQGNLDWLTCTWLNVSADATGTSMIPRGPDEAAGRFSSVTEASKYLDGWWSALRAAAPARMWFTAKGRDSQLALARTSLCVATPQAWRLPGAASIIAKAEDLALFESEVGLDAERALILYEHLKAKGFTASEWLWAMDHHKDARGRMKLPDFGVKNQILLLPAVFHFLSYSLLAEEQRKKSAAAVSASSQETSDSEPSSAS